MVAPPFYNALYRLPNVTQITAYTAVCVDSIERVIERGNNHDITEKNVKNQMTLHRPRFLYSLI